MNIKRLVRHYVLASYYGADKQLTRLIPTMIRVVRARLKYGIGPIPFSLLGIGQVAEETWDDYIIEKSSDLILHTVNPCSMHRLARNKVLFYEHCQQTGLPTIPIICRIGGTSALLGQVVEHVKDASRLNTLLKTTTPRLFAKTIGGSHGEGAFLITRHHTGFEFDGCKGSADDLFAYLKSKSDTQIGFIIQPQMRSHPKMLPLGSESGLPTARVITAMYANGPKLLFACLKIPVGKSITDNFALGLDGNLLARINLESGELSPAIGSQRSDWPVMVQVDFHADSGCRIAGLRLPFWREVAETALRGQRSLPDFKTIGWDIAVTTDGVVLVEANSNYSMHILQVAYQRGLKSELEEKLNIAPIDRSDIAATYHG